MSPDAISKDVGTKLKCLWHRWTEEPTKGSDGSGWFADGRWGCSMAKNKPGYQAAVCKSQI